MSRRKGVAIASAIAHGRAFGGAFARASAVGKTPSHIENLGTSGAKLGVDVSKPRAAYLVVRQLEALTDLGGRSVIDSSKSSGA